MFINFRSLFDTVTICLYTKEEQIMIDSKSVKESYLSE